MDDLTRARLSQLAQGKKDGEEMYPGMWLKCYHFSRCEDGCCSIEDTLEDCPTCNGGGFAPRLDPMDLMAAAAKRWKEIRVDWDDTYIKGELYCVDVIDEVDEDEKPIVRWQALEPELGAALVHAVWRATVATADNLSKCDGEWPAYSEREKEEERDVVHGPRCGCSETGYEVLPQDD